MSENLEQDFLLKADSFWKTNQKKVYMFFGAILVIVGGFYAYKWYSKGAETKAQEAMFVAQDYFAKDSFNLALNGDGKDKGFLYVIKNHSGTPAANLAKGSAGLCYLHLKDFNKAVEYLKDFSSDSKALQMAAYGALAHAYSELGKKEDAVNYYKKAATTNTGDDQTGGEYLWLAGQLLETMNKNSEAVELYKEVKEKFPKYKSGEMDKYIYRLSIEKNDFSVN
ncbi:MAG: tetratricopeptide repeat protein [Bacteroidetes bacterium]|nr:tetratricopeptide repeat protein [Bacteroidota bacterium]